MRTAVPPWITALALWLLSSASDAQVYRCGNSYSNTPCAGGKPVDTSPTVSWQGAPGGTGTVYLCQSYGGGRFWSSTHCAQREALVERMESVPAGLPFERQVELARSQRDRSQADAAPVMQPQPQPQPTMEGGGERSQCPLLEERIRQLDRAARAGGRAQTMDRIAHERKLARDQQFRLRC